MAACLYSDRGFLLSSGDGLDLNGLSPEECAFGTGFKGFCQKEQRILDSAIDVLDFKPDQVQLLFLRVLD